MNVHGYEVKVMFRLVQPYHTLVMSLAVLEVSGESEGTVDCSVSQHPISAQILTLRSKKQLFSAESSKNNVIRNLTN